MKQRINIFCLFFILFSCSVNNQTQENSSVSDKGYYELVPVDNYEFRRSYYELDSLSERELDLYMHSNPVSHLDFSNSEEHPFYNKLVEHKIILEDQLNLSQVGTLPDQFDYQLSPQQILKVETQLLHESEELSSQAYELIFKDNGEIIFTDTLEFGFPPDVTFLTMDLNKDGKQELLTIFRWYIVNGDNFDLTVYELKK